MGTLSSPTTAGRGWVWFAAALASLVVAASAAAQQTAPYPNGTSGIKAGTVPPPGHYYIMYNRLYETSRNIGPNGATQFGPNGERLGMDVTAYANVHRFIHVTDYKLFGADYAWNVVLPVVSIDLNISSANVHDDCFVIGDLNAEPFVIEWHADRYDFGLVYGLFLPTGRPQAHHPALPYKGGWTHYAGLAGTYYFDDDKKWAISALSRYEISLELDYIDITPGHNFSFEWGLSRNFGGTLDLGVSGYCSWQTTLDRGSGIDYPNTRDRVFGIGPEIQYFSPKLNLGYHLRCWWEFGAVDRTEGRIITLTFVKPF